MNVLEVVGMIAIVICALIVLMYIFKIADKYW